MPGLAIPPGAAAGSDAGSGTGRISSRRRVILVAGGCYLLAVLALTWRLWADPATRIVAGNPSDANLFAWYLRYAAAAVAHGHLPALVTTAMNAPAGVNLMWNTSVLLPGVLLTPVTLLFGPQVSLTVLATAGFAGSAWAMFWVLTRWQVSAGAAGLAGAVYGFSPALVQSTGHYNLQLAILPPLIIDAGLRLAAGRPGGDGQGAWARARRTGGWPWRWAGRVPAPVRDGIRLGVLVAAQLLISEELALLTALAGIVLVAGLALSLPRSAVRRAGPALAGLAVAVAVTLALAGHALATQFHGPLRQHGPLFPPDYYVNDVASFVTPSAALLFHTAGTAATASRYQGGATEYLAYLGWPLIIVLVLAALAALAGWRRPAARAAALTFAVLAVCSLGGHLLASGSADPGLLLPWHWLEEHPLLSSVLPDRLSIVADGAAAALLALGIDAVRERLAGQALYRAPALVLAAAAIACLPLLPRPLPAQSTTPLPAGWSLAFADLGLRAGARVLIVPVPTNILSAAMRWQADTGQPATMVGGYFIGPGAGGQEYIGGTGVAPTAWYLDQLWAAGLRPGDPLAGAARAAGLPIAGPAGPAPAPHALATGQVAADFGLWRPAAVVAVTGLDSPLGRYLAGLLGPPRIQAGGVLAWHLQPPATAGG